MAIQYMPGGRRIMPPDESRALKANPQYVADRAIGADEWVYPAGRRAAAALPENGQVTVVYTRFWSVPRWTFVTEGRNVLGDVLATATRETFDEARGLIEDNLRAQKIIA